MRTFSGILMRSICLAVLAMATALAAFDAAHAEGRITAQSNVVTSLAASSRLNLAVDVPKILFLRVGSAGSTINTVTLTLRPSGASGLNPLPRNDITFSGVVPVAPGTVARTDDFGTSNGVVSAQLWTNNGTVTLTCTGDPLADGARTLPLSRVRVVSQAGGTLAHPGTTLACSTVNRSTAGINNLASNWSYTLLTPGGMPTAGRYTTQVTYVASQP